MSKSSTGTASKNPPFPQNSAWAQGPPKSASSSRPQSPAPTAAHQTHSRRPSTLGQGIPIKDGVSINRSNVGAASKGSAVTFGSIDDAGAQISSSPVSVPPIKSEGVRSFGSVPATTPNTMNGKSPVSARPPAISVGSSPSSAASTPPPSTPGSVSSAKPKPKMDVRSLFKGSGSASAPSSTPSESSPSVKPVPLPIQQQTSSQSQSSQSPSLSAAQPPFAPFRPQQQQNSGPYVPPRSPVHPRNGAGPRPSNGPSTAPAPMGSPRMASHPPHPVPAAGMPPHPPQPMQWGYPQYYYAGVPPEGYMAYGAPPWYPMQPSMQPQTPVHPPPPPGPISPRNAPHTLQPVPGTPQPSHAVPNSPHPHPAPTHSHSGSVSGPNASPAGGSGTARLNSGARDFVPGRPAKVITIKNQDGDEVTFNELKKHTTPVVSIPPSPISTAKKSVVRMETEENRQKRLAEEQERKERERKAEEEKERKIREAKEAEERKKREEEQERERKRKEEERLKKEEEERLRREEEERLRKQKEEEERIAAEKKRKEEEAERLKKEAEEKERLRKESEEKERLRKEAEERERLRKEEEEKERLRKEEEEMERLRKEEEEAKAKAEAEAKAKAEATAKARTELEEGEVVEAEVKKPAKEGLRIDTAMPPPADLPRRRHIPGPLNLDTTSKMPITPGLPSALTTARNIDDISSIQYPEGIQSPKLELNVNAKDGKFRYDREFLLQFMSICKEKPDSLPESIQAARGDGQETPTHPMFRGGSHGRNRVDSNARTPLRQSSSGLNGFKGPAGAFGAGGMGQFATTKAAKSSDERFAMSNRPASVGGVPGSALRAVPIQRQPSQSGSQMERSNRSRSKRGYGRPDGIRPMDSPAGSGLASTPLSMEPVVPLQVSQDSWAAGRTKQVDVESPEMVDRKVKSLLNKLTMEKFDSISDQIIDWANKSEKEKDGRTLIQVIRLVFEKATDEATWSEMYARLCRKMMERISPQVRDDGIRNTEGKPIAGGQLFRKYLLNRCQEDFERGWFAKETTAAAALSKAAEDKKTEQTNKGKGEDAEAELYSEEYYAAQKAKRRGLGLIKFIGELFKLQMLTERIMHECVKKLLGNVDNPEEEEIESLCKLLTTVGAILDTNQKARAHMDIYFSRMKDLTQSGNVSSRMQFMLQDVVELRERKWVPRNTAAAPTTLAAVHDQAAKERVAQEKEAFHKQNAMSRTGSRRGHDRGEAPQPGPDGWTPVAGGSMRAPPKAGDLSQFGKITKGGPMSFGPGSIFNKKDPKPTRDRDSISRTNSSSNMFSMLSQGSEAVPVDIPPPTGRSSRPPSRKPSIDLGSSAPPDPPAQRRKLVLQPRTISAAGDASTPTESRSVSGDDDDEQEPVPAELSDADAKRKIDEDAKEFFAVRDLGEAENYFSALPASHHHRLVDKLVGIASESGKQDSAQLTADFFARALSKNLTTQEALEEGLGLVAEIIDDLAIDAPTAPKLFALVVKGANLDDERRTRIASKSAEPDRLIALLSS